MAGKTTPVSVEARRLDISILPGNFSIPLQDFMVGQSDDLQNVAVKANSAADVAYEAQLTNEEQDVVLSTHSEILTSHENRISNLEGRMDAAEGDIDDLEVAVADHEARIDALEYAVTRKKSELVFSGVSLAIPTTPVNLVTILKALTPTSGTFSPFFNTTSDKMVVFNENKSLNFKLVMIGSWTSASLNRSMAITFSGAVPDTINDIRYPGTANDSCIFPTFFSVDHGGFLATNGSTITIVSNGSVFTATTIKLIAEQ